MVARMRVLGPPKAPAPVFRPATSWPASRLNGTSPIRLLAAATLVVLGIALGTSRAGAEEAASAAPVASAIAGAASPAA